MLAIGFFEYYYRIKRDGNIPSEMICVVETSRSFSSFLTAKFARKLNVRSNLEYQINLPWIEIEIAERI